MNGIPLRQNKNQNGITQACMYVCVCIYIHTYISYICPLCMCQITLMIKEKYMQVQNDADFITSLDRNLFSSSNLTHSASEDPSVWTDGFQSERPYARTEEEAVPCFKWQICKSKKIEQQWNTEHCSCLNQVDIHLLANCVNFVGIYFDNLNWGFWQKTRYAWQ